MDQLPPEDRAVLSALQQSENALPIRTLTRLTGLTAGCMEEALKRLKSLESVELVARFGEVRYLPVDKAGLPLIKDFGPWLDLYCSRLGAVNNGDTGELTFTSCGVVILSSVLADSVDSQFLTRLTTFPEAFVKLVLEIMDCLDPVRSAGMGALVQAFEDREPELAEVDDLLQSATEELWNALRSLNLTAVLDILRAGQQYGGQRDECLDASEANWWQDWRSSELRSVCD